MSAQEPIDRAQRDLDEEMGLMLGYPESGSSGPALYEYMQVLRRRVWLVLIVALAASLAASAYSYLQAPVYRASMKMVVGTGGEEFQPGLGEFAEPFNQTIASLIESDIVARNVIFNRDLAIGTQQFLDGLDVTSRPESSVLDVTYEASNPATAVAVLEELSKVFSRLVETQLGEGGARDRSQKDARVPIAVRVFDPPQARPTAVSPRPVFNMAVAGLLGLALGVVLAFVLEAIRDPRRDFVPPEERNIRDELVRR